MTDDPFITGLQALYDAHGLPDGVAAITIGSPSGAGINAFTAWCHPRAPKYVGIAGSGPTLAAACDEALRLNLADAVMAAERDAARQALIKAGLDPAMVAA